MVLKPNNAEFFESRICPILTADPILPASTVCVYPDTISRLFFIFNPF